jgi:hypothetical protein
MGVRGDLKWLIFKKSFLSPFFKGRSKSLNLMAMTLAHGNKKNN